MTKDKFDWIDDMQKGNWKRKHLQLYSPRTEELLADIIVSPSDFTRRFFNAKIQKWHACFPKDVEVAEYFLGRLTHSRGSEHLVKADEDYLRYPVK